MVYRIEISSKISDTRADVRKKRLESSGFKGKISQVLLVDVYTINKKLSPKALTKIASSLSNEVTQTATINKPTFVKQFTWAVEIGFLPGVTDNIGSTAKEIIEDLLKIKFSQDEGVYTSSLLLIKGNLGKKEITQIAESLINPLIQRVHVKSHLEYGSGGMDKIFPKVKLTTKHHVDIVDLNVSDSELIKIGKLGIANSNGSRRGPLALDLTYMKTIQQHFKKLGRNPTDIELESIAQTWSEHCKHTIFADPIDEVKEGLFKTYIQKATNKINKSFCASVFTDNSGAIVFDDKYLVTHKVETHNSPSALDPFGGAITGIVGVNRDAIGFGLGAKPIVNTYGFCFAPPNMKRILFKDPLLKTKMLSPKRIMEGVIDGVNSGGNCSGIPTPQGFLVFDQRYQGKPLVFVGTLGLIPKTLLKKKAYIKKARKGDYIVMVGGRVGQDGIHGATFSSEALNSNSPAGAVQIGDPITQKKLSDAIVKEARALDLYNSITDNGAGGLSCSVAEMAKESGGCLVQLDRVPLKYPGLSLWQIWISESQERMTLAVPPKRWKKFHELMQRRGVEATVIGEFTNSGKCIVKYHKKVIMDVGMKFLHDGLPQRAMKTLNKQLIQKEIKLNCPKDLTKITKEMLKRLNIAGSEFISAQYDHEVQAGSVLKPLVGRGRINSEVTVTKPVLDSKRGVIISQGIIPQYSDIDTYHMAACAIDTAVRNAISSGADLDYLALLDNFCWCSSNEPERLYQLKRAVEACYDLALVYKTPFISGKDSMFNDFKGFDDKGNPIKISIPPTLLVSSIGVIKDITKVVSLDVKFAGDLVYILGETFEELGASEYYAMNNIIGNTVPKVNAAKNKKLYKDFHKCTAEGLIASSISVSRGGLIVALTKASMSGMLGLDISLKNLPGKVLRDDFALFSESQGRILVTVAPQNRKKFEKIMKKNSFAKIGLVAKDNYLNIKGLNGKRIVNLDLKQALNIYKSTFKDY